LITGAGAAAAGGAAAAAAAPGFPGADNMSQSQSGCRQDDQQNDNVGNIHVY